MHMCSTTHGEVLDVEVTIGVVVQRSLLVELARIENHLLNVSCHAGDLGCLVTLLCATHSVVVDTNSTSSVSPQRMVRYVTNLIIHLLMLVHTISMMLPMAVESRF